MIGYNRVKLHAKEVGNVFRTTLTLLLFILASSLHCHTVSAQESETETEETATPEILSPSSGSVLAGASETFYWTNNGAAVTKWLLQVGSSPGGSDIFKGGLDPAVLSKEIGGLPEDGTAVYLRLSWRLLGKIYFADYNYTAAEGGEPPPPPPPPEEVPDITSPAAGSELPGDTATFSWSANGAVVDSWMLEIGSSIGSSDLLQTDLLPPETLSYTASGLPLDGSSVYLRLSWSVEGVFSSQDYIYTSANEQEPPPESAPRMVSPEEGSTLSGATQTFAWSDNGEDVSKWLLKIGSSPGASNILKKGLDAFVTSYEVSGLPVDGSTIYVRLTWRILGVLTSADYVYTAADGDTPPEPGVPFLAQPTNGSVLPGSEAIFSWDGNGSAVDSWRLELGGSEGSADLLDSGELDAGVLSFTATGLPVDGSPVFARLAWSTAGEISSADYVFSAFNENGPAPGDPPVILSPAEGTQLDADHVTIIWDNSGVMGEEMLLQVGTYLGGENITRKNLDGTFFSWQVVGLPTDGSDIFVRLSWVVDGERIGTYRILKALDISICPAPAWMSG